METINTTTMTVTAGNAASTRLESDWRFAELIAATWVEPELSFRYAQSPEAVLAEFGIVLAEGETAPELPAAAELDLIVEDFDRLPENAAVTACGSHTCWAPGTPWPIAPTEAAAA
jgi:putative thiazole/oxazole-modified microcin (TOMM)-like peptide